MTDTNDRLDVLAAAVTEKMVHPANWSHWATSSLMASPARDYVEACDPATIRSLVAENKVLRDLLLTAAEFGHNVAVAGRGGLGHIGAFEECPQTLCANVRAALHHKDGGIVRPLTPEGQRLVTKYLDNYTGLGTEQDAADIRQLVADVEKAAIKDAFAAPSVEPRSDPEDGPNPWEPAVPPLDPVEPHRIADYDGPNGSARCQHGNLWVEHCPVQYPDPPSPDPVAGLRRERPMASEPRTDAGREMLESWADRRTHPPSAARQRDYVNMIVAIENQARIGALTEFANRLINSAAQARTDTDTVLTASAAESFAADMMRAAWGEPSDT